MLVHFLSWKILPHTCTTKSIRNKSLRQYKPHVIFQEIPQVQVVERIQEQIVEAVEVLPHERVQQVTAEQIVQTQEQSAVADLVNPPISITAVEGR